MQNHGTESLSRVRPKPVAKCTVCGVVAYSAQQINQTHHCPGRSARQRGVWGSTLNETDWLACRACGATGLSQGSRCDPCDGTGWLYNRA